MSEIIKEILSIVEPVFAIGASIFSVLMFFITKKISKIQSEISIQLDKNEENREKVRINISLFEMRFEIYDNFMHYYNYCKYLLEINESSEPEDIVSKAKGLFSRLDNESNCLWNDFVELNNKLKQRDISKEDKKDISVKINEITRKISERDFVIRKQLTDIYSKMEFCFDNLEKIQKPVQELITFVIYNFLEDIYKNEKNLEGNKRDLRKLLNKNNYENVIAEMKNQINLGNIRN